MNNALAVRGVQPIRHINRYAQQRFQFHRPAIDGVL
jgi:hypothetical protein